MGILKPSGGAGGDAGDGGGAGGGIDMAAVMGLIGSLTNRWFDGSIVEVILTRMLNVAFAQGWRRRWTCRRFPPAVGRSSRRRRR